MFQCRTNPAKKRCKTWKYPWKIHEKCCLRCSILRHAFTMSRHIPTGMPFFLKIWCLMMSSTPPNGQIWIRKNDDWHWFTNEFGEPICSNAEAQTTAAPNAMHEMSLQRLTHPTNALTLRPQWEVDGSRKGQVTRKNQIDVHIYVHYMQIKYGKCAYVQKYDY